MAWESGYDQHRFKVCLSLRFHCLTYLFSDDMLYLSIYIVHIYIHVRFRAPCYRLLSPHPPAEDKYWWNLQKSFLASILHGLDAECFRSRSKCRFAFIWARIVLKFTLGICNLWFTIAYMFGHLRTRAFAFWVSISSSSNTPGAGKHTQKCT